MLDGAQAKVEDARARNDAPPIWRAIDADSTLYLFGTVHLLPPGLDWQKDDMADAFAEAGTVFFEADSRGPEGLKAEALATQLGLRRDGLRLTDSLDDYQAKLLEAVSNNGSIPLASLDAMQPWLAAEYLTLSAAGSAGLSADLAADEALVSRARRSGKALVYLETAEDQLRSVAELPDETQLALLTDTMERFDAMPAMLDRVARDWAVGDVPALEDTLVAPLEAAPEGYVDAVLRARNEDFADTLSRFMEGSGTGFAAIGVSHLIGPDSLVSELKARGYTVTRYFAFQGEDVITPTIARLPDVPESGD